MIISLIGDIALNNLLSAETDLIGARLKPISDKINSEENIVICNLETPIYNFTGDYDELLRTELRVTTEQALSQSFKFLGIDIVSLANNHALDGGISGIKSTREFLEKNNYNYAGIQPDPNDTSFKVYRKNGISLGFMAFVHPLTNPYSKDDTRILNEFSEESLLNEVKRIKETTKLTLLVLSIHWGKDYSNFYQKWQQDIAHRLIDEGVDVIMGHHPHTIQPFEIYKGKPIFYSLGGLCFGDFFWEGKLRALKRKTKLGMIAIINEKAELIDIIPTNEKKGNYIEISKIDIRKKLKRLLWLNRLKNRFIAVDVMIHFKESVIDRIIEFFWGYYRSPFKELFRLSNFKKIRYILRDIKQ